LLHYENHTRKYNPAWRDQFEIEKELLFTILSNTNFQIEHIGSTAVEGLGAKPIIDIMIGLEDFSFANNQIERLKDLDTTIFQNMKIECLIDDFL